MLAPANEDELMRLDRREVADDDLDERPPADLDKRLGKGIAAFGELPPFAAHRYDDTSHAAILLTVCDAPCSIWSRAPRTRK